MSNSIFQHPIVKIYVSKKYRSNTEELLDDFNKYAASKSESFKELVKFFPPGAVIEINAEKFYLMGFKDNGDLIVSKICPFDNYDYALNNVSHFNPDGLIKLLRKIICFLQ